MGKRKIDLKNRKIKLVFCYKSRQKRDYIINYAKSLRKYFIFTWKIEIVLNDYRFFMIHLIITPSNLYTFYILEHNKINCIIMFHC